MINKNIVLCSDGTGNKGGYGEDSNVYKTYKAVDVTTKGVHQYTFYDQGVGTDKSDTNKNKYWTALSGAFGFGFQKNVVHLYHALARCYNPGDKIFLFGFSRGAATVRAFAGFLNTCGLVDIRHAKSPDGVFDAVRFDQLVKEALDCYRHHREDPKRCQEFKQKYAVQGDGYAPGGNLTIHFIGVWDTVSALGFPEDFSVLLQGMGRFLDRATDQIPKLKHHFYDYELNNSIQNAYQAMAIDDERQTFRPKVWDETGVNNYVEQVWFAGVHSNVGGGYPRTGMSDVALVWMLEKAVAHDLVLYEDLLTSYRESANVYDKLYDSRDGIALYYRYGPRNLEQLCAGKLKGDIAVHYSAYRKLKEISEAYAPDGMPTRFGVVDIDDTNPGLAKRVLTVDIAEDGKVGSWRELTTNADQIIAARKKLYFWFSESTMAIILLSWWLWKWPPEVVTAWQSSGTLGLIGDGLRYVTPVFFEHFITYVVEIHPWIAALMLAILVAMKKRRMDLVNRLDAICQRMTDLMPSKTDQNTRGKHE